MRILTKTNYIIGLDCPRYLWSIYNHPKKSRNLSLVEEYSVNEGNEVGELAKHLYSNGVNLPLEHNDNIDQTEQLLKSRITLFEAGFEYKNCFSRVDILVPVANSDEWDIVEVKSTTEAKEVHYHDVSFQKYILEGVGLKVRECFLLHLNDNYVRSNELDVFQLFHATNITSEVDRVLEGLEQRVEEMFHLIALDSPPTAGIFLPRIIPRGHHKCLNDGCVNLPEDNVFCLYRNKDKALDLFNMGIILIKDIPDDFELTYRQQIQKECAITKKVHINIEEINYFLKQLEYPLSYLDFETIFPAIPMFNGTRPFSQICFQFSLHVVENKGCEPKHYCFIYEDNGDPREEFILKLQKVLPKTGTIIVYNQTFESDALENIAESFPVFNDWVKSVNGRMLDLLIPFRRFHYYNAQQQGSASLKKVLPALCAKDYSTLDISDGLLASVQYFNVTYKNAQNKEKILQSLLDYCELDTLAEIMLIEKLQEIVKNHEEN